MQRRSFLMGAAAAVVRAQTLSDKGEKLLADALAAVGGDAFLKMTNRVEEGRAYSFAARGLSGLAKSRLLARYVTPVAGKVSIEERQSFGKDDKAWVLYTPEGGWDVTFRGAKPIPSEAMERYTDSTLRNIFFILRQRRKEPGMIVEFKAAEVYDNQPVNIVDITDADNRLVTVHLHRSTNIPVFQSFQRRNPIDNLPDREETRYSKFRDIGGGVQWPFNVIRERNGKRIYEQYAETVSINQKLSDDLFALPTDMKRLPAK
jgi:hypothetical protein